MLLLPMTPAHAITYDEIPPGLRQRLPEFILRIIDPRALAALNLADIEEYADSYESGDFFFVNKTTVVEHSGPLSPELAILVLQVPQGAPYVEKRFIRMAKRAFGNGTFNFLQWEVFRNADDSVDIHLYYRSGSPQAWIPEPSYNVIASWLYGVRYQDLSYGGKNRQLSYGLQLSEKYLDEPGMWVTYTDSTLNRGSNSYSVSASVGNDWRRRLNGTPAAADMHLRTTRIGGSYSWRGAKYLGSPYESVGVGAGIYNVDHFVIAGDPTAEGTAPRSDFDQSGTAGYISASWASGRRDMSFTPREGWYYLAKAEQHFGDFTFNRFSFDVRQYMPVANPLGHGVATPNMDGHINDIRHQFPAASFAVQLQASLASGDVPYGEEQLLGYSGILRGYPYDSYVGTKLLAARAEYRFALDYSRSNEAFVFTDHALIGESLGSLESLNSYGAGAIFNVPIYGGVKLGLYLAQAFDGSEDSFGLALGYLF